MINYLRFLTIKMFLTNIPNDILEFIFKFLSGEDKLNLIKIDKMLIYNLMKLKFSLT